MAAVEAQVRRVLEAHVREHHVMGRLDWQLDEVYEWDDLMRDVYLTPGATDDEIVELSTLHVLAEWMFCTDGCRDGGSGPVMCSGHRDLYPD